MSHHIHNLNHSRPPDRHSLTTHPISDRSPNIQLHAQLSPCNRQQRCTDSNEASSPRSTSPPSKVSSSVVVVVCGRCRRPSSVVRRPSTPLRRTTFTVKSVSATTSQQQLTSTAMYGQCTYHVHLQRTTDFRVITATHDGCTDVRKSLPKCTMYVREDSVHLLYINPQRTRRLIRTVI